MKKLLFRILFLLLLFLFFKKKTFTYFTHWHNERILNEIKAINTDNYILFSKFLHDIERETDWQVKLTSGYRTHEEQEELNKNDKRNANAGKSKHNFAKAIDLNLYQNGWFSMAWLMKSSSKQRWEQTGILSIAQKYKLKWGGHFKRYYDPVHFEIE